VGAVAVTMALATAAATGIARPAEAGLKTLEPFAGIVASRVPAAEPVTIYRRPPYAVLFYLRRRLPVEYARFEAMPAPGWALVWEEDWTALGDAERAGAEIVESSRPTAPNRPASRLFLVRLRARA
jgi:hypothetical protein